MVIVNASVFVLIQALELQVHPTKSETCDGMLLMVIITGVSPKENEGIYMISTGNATDSPIHPAKTSEEWSRLGGNVWQPPVMCSCMDSYHHVVLKMNSKLFQCLLEDEAHVGTISNQIPGLVNSSYPFVPNSGQ